MDELQAMAYRRLRTVEINSAKFGVAPLSFKDVYQLLKTSVDSGGLCYYCGKQMKLVDEKPYKNTYSIDHKISLARHGTNDHSNLVVCCHECNIVKGTMSASTFMRLIQVVRLHDPELLSMFFIETWDGKFANKLERNDALK